MEEESQLSELFVLLFNSGIAMALVQVIKTKLIPVLKTDYPWALPIIAMALGSVTSVVLSRWGLDISAIVGAFSGLASAGAFATVKEAKFLKVG